MTDKDNYHQIMVSFNEIENVAGKIGEKINAKAVILFGSYARNQPGKHSDVDILVIAESNLPRHKRSRQLHLMFKPYPFPMDILVYTPREVEKESEYELSFISPYYGREKSCMDKKLEYAKRWFDKAKNDLLDADNNLAADKVPYDTVCFHCQQAAEKLLKGFLVTHGCEYPLTHNLFVILDNVVEHELMPRAAE